MNARQKQLIKNSPHAPVVPVKDTKGGFSITFVHLGRKYYQITLWASTYVSQRKWVENIQKQQDTMRERSNVFETVTLSEGFFLGVNRVNCAAPFRTSVLGTCTPMTDTVHFRCRSREEGSVWHRRWRVPLQPLGAQSRADKGPRTQRRRASGRVGGLSALDRLIRFAKFHHQSLRSMPMTNSFTERQVITFPLDALDPMDPLSGLKRAKRIASHISFFKAGVCLGKTLVCVVKSSPLSSTIKTLEPIDQHIRGRAKPTFRKLLQGGNDTLRVFKARHLAIS